MRRMLWTCLVALGAAWSQPARPAGPDLTKQPTLYVVGYAHLDTQWRWEYPTTMSQCERKANAPVTAKAFSVQAVPRVAVIAVIVEKHNSTVLFGLKLKILLALVPQAIRECT